MTHKIVRLLPGGASDTGLASCQFVDPAACDGDAPQETGHNFFTSADKKLLAGVWEASPYKERIDGYPVDEFMLVLDGSVTITEEGGAGQTFSAGEAFIIPKGFCGTWENTETMRKYYVIYE